MLHELRTLFQTHKPAALHRANTASEKGEEGQLIAGAQPHQTHNTRLLPAREGETPNGENTRTMDGRVHCKEGPYMERQWQPRKEEDPGDPLGRDEERMARAKGNLT